MQSSKHWAALGLLGAFGVLIVTGSKKPAEKFDSSSLPPVDRRQTALVASYVVSASDVCLRANAPDPSVLDAESLQALRDACNRAAEDQARALNWEEGDWEIVHPGTEYVETVRQKPGSTPRVARRTPNAAVGESPAIRNR